MSPLLEHLQDDNPTQAVVNLLAFNYPVSISSITLTLNTCCFSHTSILKRVKRTTHNEYEVYLHIY